MLNKLDEMYPKSNVIEREEIRNLKRRLNTVANALGKLQRGGQQRGSSNFAYDVVKNVDIEHRREWLRGLLGMSENARAQALNQVDLGPIQKVADFVIKEYRKMVEASDAVKSLLDPKLYDAKTASDIDLRSKIKQYYDDYEYYDQIIFPIFYETSVGEAEPASVIRISPEDAPSIINEKTTSRRKLAGLVLFHFGAFFDRLWRSNDILWGRLDGAERIINALLPRDSSHAKELIRKAHLAIIREQLRPQEQAELKSIIVRAILSMPRDSRDKEANLRQILESQTRKPVDSKVEAVFTACLDDDEIYHYLKTSYEVNREFEPARALDILSRSTQIIGQMFEDVAKSAESERVRGALAGPSAWIARLGSVFWGIVQVAIPGGLGNKVVRHWLKILYFLEVLLLAGSTIAISPTTQQFAVTSLLFTAGVHLLVTALGDLMRTRHWLIRMPLFIVVLGILSLALLGAWTVKTKAGELNTAIQKILPWAPSEKPVNAASGGR